MQAVLLSPDRHDEAVSVLCDAFHDYPVMRYVLGPAGHYEQRLRTLVGFFAAARLLREEPVLGVADPSGRLVAAAMMTLPASRPAPPALAERREAAWADLGAEERRRYEAFGAAWQAFPVTAPHHHLNMIGVRRSHAGTGLARPLLEAVHALAAADPGSAGVSLTTENPKNLALYERFGYRVVGHHRISAELESWGMFREGGR